MEKLWSIRRYKKEDKDQLFELYRDVWNQETAELCKKKWSWKFENNPNNLPEGPFILILDYSGKIVGFLAGISTRLLIKGKIYPMPWLVDLMTHPKYRGRGYLLVKEALANNSLIAGFPNETAYLLWNKRYKIELQNPAVEAHLAFIPLIKRPLDKKNVVAKLIKNKLVIKVGTILLNMVFESIFKAKKSPDITITQISSFDNRINEFWNYISKNFNALAVRDMKYLNWRFVDCPDVKYTIFLAERKKNISGYIVLRVCQDKGYIVDFLAEKDGFESLIWQAIRYFKQQKVNSICCLAPTDTFYRKRLNQCGFFTRKGYPVYRFIGRSRIPELPMEFLREPKNWFLTLGDSDIEMIM